jgi:hypothetical protein
MRVETRADIAGTLQRARNGLQSLARTTETGIAAVARTFEDLAGHTDTILNLAGSLIDCVENEAIRSVLREVQALGDAARRFIHERLEATGGILETVSAEVELLRHLSQLTRGQKGIARESNSLSVLTNIEVARLGAVGAGFQYLARELTDFSQSVAADTRELTGHTEERRMAIEETRRALQREIPRMHQEFARIEGGLASALAVADRNLAELLRIPEHFRTCVLEIAAQIAGVVAAVQAHDITRQQIEHVDEALTTITEGLEGAMNPESVTARTMPHLMPEVWAGLAIQIYQLRSIRTTVAGWATQIETCMGAILRISSSDVVAIGPAVLEQERELSLQLEHMESLERECESYNEKVKEGLGGLSSLMHLVSEHLDRSKSVKDRLQLLTFNSIIEASHLGTQADAILAISQSIKQISTAWSGITEQSGQAMGKILGLVERTNQVMQAFSEAGNQGLRAAQAQTRAGLISLRNEVAGAAQQAEQMKAATQNLQAMLAKAGGTGKRFDTCFSALDAALEELESLRGQLESDYPEAMRRFDAEEMERRFSASYTTEMERDILRAALRGEPLPMPPQSFAGNEVELF